MECTCNYHLGMGPNLECPVHGEENRKQLGVPPKADDTGPSSGVAQSCVGAYSFDHECEKILDFDVGEGEERDVWVGEITSIADDLPDEDWCLHIQTPEKPEIVFGLVHADLVCLTGIIRGILGHVPDNPIAKRIAERAREA